MSNKLTWFDLDFRTKLESPINCCLLKLFDLIKEGLHIYFNIKDSQDINDFLIKAERQNKDNLFIEWIRYKGIPKSRSIDFNNLPTNDRFLAMLEFDEYVLKSEMDYKDIDEIRSCIISTVTSLQQYIDLCKEELSEELKIRNAICPTTIKELSNDLSSSSSILNDITGGYTVKRGSI
ncbi:hypothetical protein [Bacillus velezensis]|uniref:hypothetical protein n=1 Tax=Bacillus velezensis TaxID=492670 RepID=UPI001F5DDDE0|nr:hypothetical protein [Bacillus velezensis]BCT30442.1 hypothetical protein BVAD3_41160 [Bacillus velezensis]